MQKIEITNAEALKLVGLTSGIKPDTKAIFLSCHGFRGGKENSGRLEFLAKKLEALNIALFAFDFSGNGESAGEFASTTLSRQIQDVHSILNYLNSISNVPIILQGRSFGGATAIAAAADYKNVKAIILWSTLIHLESVFRHMLGDYYDLLWEKGKLLLPGDPESFELKSDILQDFAQHDMKKYLQAIKHTPCLIVHGLADDVVSVDNALDIKSIIPLAELHLVPEADHRFTGVESVREDLTIDFLKKLF